MPGPVPYTDIGGGGSLPPHGEDFFNRIVNVHWRKRRATISTFVIATIKGEMFRVDLTSVELQPVSLPVNNIYSVVGCDYGAGVFVVAGSKLNVPAGSSGFICTSIDGNDWSSVFVQPAGSTDVGGTPVAWGGTISAIVYSPDNNMFAASGLVIKFGEPIHEEIYTSGEGYGWSTAFTTDIISTEQAITHASTFPANFCSHHIACQDDFGHSVPGGIMYSGMQIFPAVPPTVYYWENSVPGNIDYHTVPRIIFGGFDEPIGPPPSNSIIIQGDGGVVVPGLAIVTCVAGGGRTWLVGGFTDTSEDSAGGVVLTSDGGENWTLLGVTSSGVVGIAAR